MIALVDERIDDTSLLTLKAMGAELFLMPPASYLQKGVASHPDMLVFCAFGRLSCHAKYYKEHKELIDAVICTSRLKLTLSDENTGSEYPCDVLFNAALVGDTLVCNKKTVSTLILEAAEDAGCKILHVPQGYTKCSTAIVSDNAIITADKPIFNACLSAGIDALLVSADGVDLPDYNCGFIGGASGTFGDNMFFCGNITLHPDGEAISIFCQKHDKTAVSLSNKKLFDVGTIIFI